MHVLVHATQREHLQAHKKMNNQIEINAIHIHLHAVLVFCVRSLLIGAIAELRCEPAS